MYIKKFFNIDNLNGVNIGKNTEACLGRREVKGVRPTAAKTWLKDHQSIEDNSGLKETKDWKLAVTIHRTNTKSSWGGN